MKNGSLFIIVIFISTSILANAKGNYYKKTFEDSTLHQRFIMSLLQEYNMEGR